MQINGKVHCFFEQSGTFKNEFKKLGYQAFDYDIQNDYGQTDFVTDLFSAIETAWHGGGQTVFDSITPDDLIIAFFPCIYFCETSQNLFRLSNKNYQNLNTLQKIEKILERSGKRAKFFDLFIQFVGVCFKRNLRIVIENPASSLQFLSAFLKSPSIVDKNRSLRGDYYRKPTAYWFFNCEPTHGFSEQRDKEVRNVWDTKGSDTAGICGKERSLMSTDYARNWICDFILGKNQPMMQQSFDFDF